MSLLQDGFLLAQFLGRPDVTTDTLHIALQVYDEIRRPLAQKVVALSHLSGQLHSLEDPDVLEDDGSERALTPEELRRLGNNIEKVKEWRRVTSLLDENEVSMRRLAEAIGAARTS